MSKKVFVHTFGCKMNEYDTELMLSLLKEEGIEPTEAWEEADILIVNACSVRESAEKKALATISRFCAKKRKKPLKIGVAGCMAERMKEELFKCFPEIDFIMSPSCIHEIPSLIKGEKRVATGKEGRTYIFPHHIKENISSSVPIMEGCSLRCTYCVVPNVRGRAKSFPLHQIIEYIEKLVEKGCKEVLLLGQCVNAYKWNGADFSLLLHKIHEIDGLLRIKFTTSYPLFVTPSFIEAMKLQKVCEWLHLPVQSGSDKILERMKRGYKRKDYIERIRKLKDAIPHLSITTDIMVGFPGESEDDFKDTLSLIKEVEFDHAFVFKFCPRPSTPASSYREQIPEPLKSERLLILLEEQRKISSRKLQSLIGGVQYVLIEGKNPKNEGELMGRSRTHKVVRIPFTEGILGKEVAVRIKEVDGVTLKGILL